MKKILIMISLLEKNIVQLEEKKISYDCYKIKNK